ncbi:alpha/beta fold hydrolase [Planctomyces sp. SH-PL14]|uniref:alpha/beta fold hydrolase n=1 Tax=Planctomyces sp. SH-PL14 TaxID=1632864 RepID=UPI00094668A9|nr:alpha/beta fold hydrolase [Planctomyces sp. SH-PL14]
MTAPPPAPPAAGEGCPTPLAWAEVVQAFQELGEVREHAFSRRAVTSRRLGRGKPIYFLNHASGDGLLFALTAWLLKDEAECVVIDYPAVRSGLTAAGFLPAVVEGLEQVRSDLGHGSVNVYGATLGGLCGLEWMRQRPGSVARGILQTPMFSVPWTPMERTLFALGRRLPGTLAGLPGWKGMLERNHRDWFPPFDPTRWDFLLANQGATPLRDAAVRLRAAGTPLSAETKSIAQPVLIVRTEGEGAGLTRNAETLAATLPHATTEWMHTAGHSPFLTHPHRLVKLIRAHLLE